MDVSKIKNKILKAYLPIASFFKKHRLTQCAFFSLLTLIASEALCRHSVIAPFVWAVSFPYAFLFNYLIILLTFAIAMFFPKETFAFTLTASFWLILALVNCIVLMFRITPFSAIDFSIAINMLGIIDIYLNIFQLALIIVGSLVFISLMILLWKKTTSLKINLVHNTAFLLAIIILITGMGVIGRQTGLLERKFPNLNQAYKDYGFAYCFSLSIFDVGINEPAEYTDATVDDILNEIGANKDSPPENTPNILIVQLESFFDINRVSNLVTSSDPVPNFTKLQNEYPHGLVTVPSIGGGTANTEFEVLTGMNLDHFGPGEYPYKTVLQSKTCETPAFTLKNYGYTSHAIHNHKATFYDRHLIYSSLGFDTFTPLEMMYGVEFTELGWAKDNVLADNIFNCLNSTAGRDFVFTVTVQPHGKYPDYELPSEEQIKVELENITDEEKNAQYQYYTQQLYETDMFIGELVQRLSEYEEPVAVLFYGDHFPTIYLEDGCLTEGTKYQTDWVIWSNYNLKAENKDVMSYQLVSHFLKSLGSNLGMTTKIHNMADTIEKYQEKLEILEYDILYGDLLTFDGTSPYLHTDMVMGVSDIYVTNLEYQNERLYVYGNKFNDYTCVKINGRLKTAVIVDENLLYIDSVDVHDDDTIQLVQMTSDRVELRSSAEYEMKSFLK